MREVVFARKHMILVKKKYGYVVINTKGPFKQNHTHVRDRDMGVVIINNVLHNRLPKTDNIRILESHIRVSTDSKYIEMVRAKINRIKFSL